MTRRPGFDSHQSHGIFQPNLLCFVLCYGFHITSEIKSSDVTDVACELSKPMGKIKFLPAPLKIEQTLSHKYEKSNELYNHTGTSATIS